MEKGAGRPRAETGAKHPAAGAPERPEGKGACAMGGFLAGKRALIVGVLDRHSLCWGIAESMAREGASLCLTYLNERMRPKVQDLAATLPDAWTAPLDLQQDEQIEALASLVKERWGGLDALVEGAAFARAAHLSGEFLQVDREGFHTAMDVSVYGLIAMSRACRPLLCEAGGGAVLTLTYLGAQRVIPNYNIMGVAKAALEASVRYLASDLGPDNIRVNAISSGPVRTVAASGVKGVGGMIGELAERAPLRRKTEKEHVGDAAAFLLSDLGRGITGETLFVDNGVHILGL